MKAIFQKELRENLKWAAALMLALGLLFVWSISESRYLTFASEAMLMAVVGGFSAVAAILGLLQVFQDRWRDRYSFITHRPISRSKIFRGKVLAGLSLYAIATAVPLLITIAWSATPNNAPAPFDWQMSLPALADWFTGSAWYFAGILVATREARWFGSRIMPFGLALLGTVCVVVFTLNIWEALLIAAVLVALLAIASHSSYVHAGVFERQKLMPRAIQTFGIAVGFCMIMISGGVLISQWIWVLVRSEVPLSQSYIKIDQRGRVLQVDRNDKSETLRVTDLSSQPPANVEFGREAILDLPVIGLLLHSSWPEDLPAMQRRAQYGLHQRARYAMGPVSTGSTAWYYLTQRRIFRGFDTRTYAEIGSIGPDGFTPPGQVARPFDSPLQYLVYGIQYGMVGSNLMAFDRTTVYRMDMASRQVSRIFQTTEDDPIISVASAGPHSHAEYSHGGPTSIDFIGVSTHKMIHIVRQGNDMLSIPRQYFPPDHYSVNIGKTVNGSYILSYSFYDPRDIQRKVIELNAQGQIVKETDAPPMPMSGQPQMVREILGVAAVPPALVLMFWIDRSITLKQIISPGYLALYYPAVAIVCAVIAWWLARRYSLGQAAKKTWAALCALFGLPGVAALIAMRTLPTRVRCPSCGKHRVILRDTCEHCGAPFPPPQAQGIEIIE